MWCSTGGTPTNPALPRCSQASRHPQTRSEAAHPQPRSRRPGRAPRGARTVGRMYLPAVALMGAQHGLITAASSLAPAWTPHDVRRLRAGGRLVRLRRGVYVDATPGRAAIRTGAALLRMRAAGLALTSRDYAYSHDSAAIVLGMGAPDPARRSSTSAGRRSTATPSARASSTTWRRSETSTSARRRPPPAQPSRTALDMAREHGRAHGLAACDGALRAGVTRSDLVDVAGDHDRWPHTRCMRWCIEHADALAESYLESLVRDFVLELGIGRPELQFGLTDGRRTAFADLRVRRHLFEADGLLKYEEDNPSGKEPAVVLAEEKQRHDFLTGFKLGVSRRHLRRHVQPSSRRAGPGGARVRRHVRPVRHGDRRPGALPGGAPSPADRAAASAVTPG